MSALFSASAASMDTVLQHAALYGLTAFLFGYLGKTLIDLWISRMGRQSTMDEHAAAALRLATKDRKPPHGLDDPPEIAPEDEPWWDGKAPHDSGVRHLNGVLNPGFGNPYPADPPAGLPESTGGDPGRSDLTGVPPETPAETSGRHALTESMPAVVDDERALAVVASVAGEDGET